jgi:hypothetical protein
MVRHVNKIVFMSRNAKRPKPAAVRTKRVVGTGGKVAMMATLDADSKSFSEELRGVFERNVRKARRENKRVTGLADFVPAKR